MIVERNGCKLYYEVTEPEGAAGEVPTVIFTHGVGSGSLLWQYQVAALKASGRYRSVVWDMRGHAKSESPDDASLYSKMDQALDLKAVLDASGCTDTGAILCGHSMGGFDNMLFYFIFPEYVNAFVLYATGPGFSKEKARVGWNKVALKLADGYAAKGLDALVGSDKAKGHRTAVGLEHCARKVYAQLEDDPLFVQLADGPLHAARNLDKIVVPAKIIVGERDKAFFKACQMMNAKLPNSDLTVIPGMGHMVAEKNGGAEFNPILLHYLDAIGSEISAQKIQAQKQHSKL